MRGEGGQFVMRGYRKRIRFAERFKCAPSVTFSNDKDALVICDQITSSAAIFRVVRRRKGAGAVRVFWFAQEALFV